MAPATMRAAVFHPGNTDLVIDNHHPVTKPGKGQVLVRVVACGICHSDETILSGNFPATHPFTIGHEACGYVEQVGEAVDDSIKKGVLYTIYDFVPCARAIGGIAFTALGVGEDGLLADFALVDQKQLTPVPHGLKPEVAALAGCSTTTAYHALHGEAGLTKGSNKQILIIGFGGLGHQAIQIAHYFGSTVYVCDIKPAARKLAQELGAKQVFDVQRLTDATSKGFAVDIVVDFVASGSSFTLGLAAVRGNDTVFGVKSKIVLVGANLEQLSFNSLASISQNVDIISSLYGSKKDQEAALHLLAIGAIQPHITTHPLEDANKIVDQLRALEVTGRSVVVLGKGKSVL